MCTFHVRAGSKDGSRLQVNRLPSPSASGRSSAFRRVIFPFTLVTGFAFTTFLTLHGHVDKTSPQQQSPATMMMDPKTKMMESASILLPKRNRHLQSTSTSSSVSMSTMTINKPNDQIVYLPGVVTVVIPIYQGSGFVDQMMRTLKNQTYLAHLDILISIEPSDDADETEAVLKSYQQNSPMMNLRIQRQPHRLQFAANVVWLLERVQGEFYSYMQCDDTLPSNYYEALVKCLQANPQAVNCYPYVQGKHEDPKLNPMEPHHDPSVVGAQHQRVHECLARQEFWAPFRGMVRRPHHSSYKRYNAISRYFQPRLHKIYTSSDLLVNLRQCIDGEMIEVPTLPYYKYYHHKAIHVSQFQNASVLPAQDLKMGLLDEHVRRYNMVHSYVGNTRVAARLINRKLKTGLGYLLQSRGRGGRITDEQGQKQLQKDIDDISHQYWRSIRKPKRVAVLGAGIQGCLLALMFRKHGYDVTLIDKSSDIMNRASRVGEGRIHMGLEYSNDPTMSTAEYMLRSSLRFSSYVEYLVGRKIDWDQLKSERLRAVMPHDSLVTPKQFEEYAERLGNMYEHMLMEEPELSYLGERPPKIVLGKAEIPKEMDPTYVAAAYDAIEVCILSSKLKEILREAIDEQGIKTVLNREVLDVRRNKEGKESFMAKFKVVTNVGESDYDVVVNSLWENRAAIDRQMGINHHADNESYRIKASIRLPNLREHANIPSVSIMNGPFGDFLRYGPEDQVYFAWHPVSLHVITQNETEIHQFERHVNYDFPEDFHKHMVEGHRAAFEKLFPHADSSFFDEAVLGAGYVVGNGETDIDDPQSGLHKRDDSPNYIADGYISVKTQKLTSAPYNAYLLEQELFKDTLVADK